MQYGQEIAEKLKSQYIGVKIKDFGYDYIAEDFYIKLDNKNEEVIWLGLT